MEKYDQDPRLAKNENEKQKNIEMKYITDLKGLPGNALNYSMCSFLSI